MTQEEAQTKAQELLVQFEQTSDKLSDRSIIYAPTAKLHALTSVQNQIDYLQQMLDEFTKAMNLFGWDPKLRDATIRVMTMYIDRQKQIKEQLEQL